MDTDKSLQLLERRLKREKSSRRQAEHLLEIKSRELYESNIKLKEFTESLEAQIEERTVELKDARDKAMSANRAKTTFLATMSHEIRTPMNGVIGMANLLVDSKLSSEQKRQASVIVTSAESLLRIINDILDLSKLESGKFELQIQEFKLCSLLDSIMSSLAIVASDKKLEVINLVERGTPIYLSGDSIRLRQVLVNLLGNAIKFTGEGHIMLQTKLVQRQGKRAEIRFEIHDTGDGMSERQQKKLFKPFSQVTAYDEKKHKQQGTGLGLSISKKLVNLMGGEIGVMSQVGKGSTFWAHIPFDVERELELPESDSSEIVVFQPRDDIRRITRSQVKALAKANDKVISVTNLYQIFELEERQREGKFHVIIDTEYLPNTERERLIDYLKQHENRLKNWIFIVSVSERNNAFSQYLDNNKARITSKPISQMKIFEMILKAEQAATQQQTNQNFCSISEKVKAYEAAVEKEGKRVLLVEDNRVNQMVAKGLLSKHKLDVTIANDGIEAIETYQKEDKFDLIFMDVNMPRMGGIEATQILQKMMKQEGTFTPIVVLTANAMHGAEEEYREAGMDDFLTKPIDVAKLTTVLDRWLAPESEARNQAQAVPA